MSSELYRWSRNVSETNDVLIVVRIVSVIFVGDLAGEDPPDRKSVV